MRGKRDAAVLLPAEVGVRGKCVALDSLGVRLSESAKVADLAGQNFSVILSGATSIDVGRLAIINYVVHELRVDLGARFNAHFSPYTRVLCRRDAVEAWTSHTKALFDQRRGERAGVTERDLYFMLEKLKRPLPSATPPPPPASDGAPPLLTFEDIRPRVGLVPRPAEDIYTVLPALFIESEKLAAERQNTLRKNTSSAPHALCKAPRIAGLPPGIINNGDTCHTSALLQALYATRLVRHAVLAFAGVPARGIGAAPVRGAPGSIAAQISALDAQLNVEREQGRGPAHVAGGNAHRLLAKREQLRVECR